MDSNSSGSLFVVFLLGCFVREIYGRNLIPPTGQHQKPAVLTVKSIAGDTYDCVDLMKQPSFQNVDYHKQEEILRGIIERKDMEKVDDKWKHKIWLGEGCPNGTVPIPRKRESHNLSYNFTAKTVTPLFEDHYNGGFDLVGMTVEHERLFGAFATISIHHPAGVTAGQYSSARVRLQNFHEQEQTEEFVEAGWTVNPDFYGDDKTRLYCRWQGIHNAGCFNTKCPGFVITDPQIPIDYAFPQISNPGTGEHHDVDIDIQIGDDNPNWYLKVNGKEIGYWKGELFQNLTFASGIAFSGEVYSKPPTRDSPPMGSGKYMGDNEEFTAYMQNVQVRLDKFFAPIPNYVMLKRSRCYLAGWEGYSRGSLNGFSFLFGGKGGRADETCIDF